MKPANIILVEGNRAKITDFGIAKIASGGANLTTTGQFLGTPNYMAPEQIKGAPVDGRSDIFSLGICLYECLTRRKPFGGDSLTSISYKIVHEPFPPLHEINPQIPDGFTDVVATCLAKDPTKRYQRAKDLANALRAVIRGERPVRPPDPMLADETMVTRDREKLPAAMPTVEVPFPEAAEFSPEIGANTNPVAGSAAAAVAAGSMIREPARTNPKQPIAGQFRNTLSNVRTLPLWRRRIAPPLFLGIVVLLVAALIGGVATIRSKHPDIPPVDTTAEKRGAQERKLREEANALLRQGRVTEAYARYQQLLKLSPGSPYVIAMMQRLNAIRAQEAVSKQQRDQSQQKFQEGMALFNDKKYPQAIQLFQEAFSINPSSNEAAEYLKLAQQEQQKADAARSNRNRPPNQQRGTTTPIGGTVAETGTTGTTQTVAASPASLTTVFTHPFTDGHVVVRIGADIVVNEKIFDEKPARLFRRASRVPRPVNVTSSLPAKNADVQIWVTAPQQNVQEHHVMTAVRFDAGSSHRLTIRYDEASKKFSYELN